MTVKIDDLKEILKCGICFNLYEDPITIPCGHIFCLDCITQIQPDPKISEIANCPICQKSFRTQKKKFWNHSIPLVKLIELIKKTEKQKKSIFVLI